ncbi:hypothetical protein BCR43DRAFT_483502 [Syncephalastrum racemosum]|uniref:DDRGK domain-domain-containing protein n=1 Tax=Syncephalastrum racemosum TaxID=13706 RepID=A0A1X2HVB8_SYNRA|nr:hypothetical protein BCR43DRAFT_483502 [Syncephalastrum racemosum]
MDQNILILIPFLLFSIAAIVIYRNHINRRLREAGEEDALYTRVQQLLNDEEGDDLPEEVAVGDEGNGEGSSAGTLRVRKMGKKRGEKLRRKEQQRQYREYMNHQRDLRRVQDERLEEEFRQRKAIENIRQSEEAEQRKKAQARKAKQEEKERQKRQKAIEKEESRRKSRYSKYHAKVAEAAKRLKLCSMDALARETGLDAEEAEAILRQLCMEAPEFNLSLWSGNSFLHVTDADYAHLAQQDMLNRNHIMSLVEPQA